MLKELSVRRGRKGGKLPAVRQNRSPQQNSLLFDVRAALFALLGKDLTQINGLGPYLALKLIAEGGDDLSAWPSAKHFTSWLCLAPSNKLSGGKVLSARTRRSGNRAAALLRLAAATVERTDTALGAFYRRFSARIGKGPGRDRYGAKDRSSVLQCVATRDGRYRSGRILLRTPIPRARDQQSASASQGLRLCTPAHRPSALLA